MRRILIKSTVALALSIAPGLVFAQAEPQRRPDEQPESRGGSPNVGQEKPAQPRDQTIQKGQQGETTKQRPAPEQGEAQGKQSDKDETQGKRSEKGHVSEKQRGELREVFRKAHVEPAPHVDFSVKVGARVPREVRLHRLPPRIVELVPEYRGYEYFVLADGRIVIVDPETLVIVIAIN